MAKYVFQKEQMPHYSQVANACGITAALMAIQPNIDVQAQRLLEKTASKARIMYGDLDGLLEPVNSRHQVAAAYLLLKCAFSPKVHELIGSYDPENYEFIQGILEYEIRNRMSGRSEKYGKSLDKMVNVYLKKGEKWDMDKVFLYEYTTRIKTDVELKLLMALFGYKFVRFPYSADGTGSVNFDTIEQIISSNVIKDDQLNSYDEIFEFMITFVEVNFDKSVTIINTGAHWVTAQQLILQDEKRIPELFYLDPTSSPKPIRLNDWKRNIWFYFFQPDEQLRDRIKPIVEKVLDLKY
nr:hypothetical protein [Candidatus Sigynarchaeum springense]